MTGVLAKAGWRLNPEWDPLSSSSGKSSKDVNILALNTDLKDSGAAYIADILAQGSGTGTLDVGSAGAVLQVTKIRNIAAPKSNEDSGVAPRMLKLILTDGHSNLQALEIERLEKISLSTPPGTKVRLKPSARKIVFKNGFALIESKHLELLGGKVEPLIEKWEISQKLAQFTRAQNTGVEGAPPPWVPFGKNIGQVVDRDFKALTGGAADSKDDTIKDENTGFESQRKDAIEEAAKQGGRKVFGGGNKEIKEGSKKKRDYQSKENTPEDINKPKSDQRQGNSNPGGRFDTSARDDFDDRRSGNGYQRGGRGRGGGGRGRGGRGGRDRDGDDNEEDGGYGQSKPSQGVSLFDFLEEKFPGAHDVPEKSHKQRNKDPPQQYSRDHHQNRGNEDNRRDYNRNGEGGRFNDHPKGRKDNRQGGREDREQRGDRRQEGRGGGPQNRREVRGGREEGNNYGNRRENNQAPTNSGKNDRTRHQQHGGSNNFPQPQYEDGPEESAMGPNRWGQARESNQRRQQQQQAPSGGSQPQFNNDNYGRDNRRPGGAAGGNNMNAAGRNMHQRGGDGNAQSDRDFGEWSNSTYTESQKPRPGDRRSNRQNHHANNHQQGNSRDWNQASNNNSSANAKSSSNHGSNNNSGGRGGVKGGSNVPKWQVGDECLAKYWEDGGFYSAKITAMSKSTAVVLFQEYGNHEEVMLTDIMTVPFMGRSANDSGSGNNSKRSGGGSGGGRYIPTTPGLPPAFKQST